MFKAIVDNNYDVELQESAKQTIIKERKIYEDLHVFILNFSKEHNMLISNIDLLLDKQDYWNLIDIYTLNVDELSKQLVSELCKKFDKVFLLKIFEADKEYYIEYNLRRLCVLNSIKPYKTFTLYDFISPIHYKIHYDKDKSITIYLLPYLIEVINLYKTLYDPNTASSWETIYKDIKRIEVHVDKEIEVLLALPRNDLALKLSTSSPQGGNPDKPDKRSCKTKRKEKVLDIKALVMDFIKDGHYILLQNIDTNPDTNTDTNTDTNPSGVIQVISSNIEIDHKLIVNFLSRFIEYGVTYKKKNIYLPKEFQLEKYNFYLEIPCVKKISKKHFMTIYNNTSYELINYYEKDGFKYADPIVQLRFKYLDIWSSIIMQKTHGLHYDEFIQFIKNSKIQIKDLRNNIDLYELKKNYTGIYLPFTLSKKMLMINMNPTKSSYYCHDFSL